MHWSQLVSYGFHTNVSKKSYTETCCLITIFTCTPQVGQLINNGSSIRVTQPFLPHSKKRIRAHCWHTSIVNHAKKLAMGSLCEAFICFATLSMFSYLTPHFKLISVPLLVPKVLHQSTRGIAVYHHIHPLTNLAEISESVSLSVFSFPLCCQYFLITAFFS